MKTNKYIQYIILNFLFLIFTNSIYCQEWQATDFGYYGHNIDFLNANTGFIGVTIIEDNHEKYKILKTTNKGISFSPIWTSTYNDWNVKGVGFDMISEQTGYVYTEGILYRTTNGGNNWVQRFQIAYEESFYPIIKFANENLGFISYTRYPFVALDTAKQKIYKITNGGNSWTILFSSSTANNWTPIIKDISISDTNIIMVGYYHNFQQQGQIRRYTLTSTNSGEGFGPEYDGGVYGTQFSDIQYLPGSSTEYRIIGSENYGSGNPDNGTYCYDNFVVGNKFKISNGTENIAGLSFVDANKGYAYVDNKLYKTTNSGVNWGAVYTFEQNSLTTNRNALIAFNDIVYTVEHVGNLVTHKLATNLYSFFDNQSGSGAITFDGVEYSTPGIPFLRGGESSISSIDLNPNQINEKIFY